RFHDQVDRSPGVASSLRPVLRLRGELVDRVNRQDNSGNSGDAALIYCRNVVPEVIVVHTVNLPVHLVGTRPIQGTESAYGISSVTGIYRDQLRKIPPVEWNILDYLRLDGLFLVRTSSILLHF